MEAQPAHVRPGFLRSAWHRFATGQAIAVQGPQLTHLWWGHLSLFSVWGYYARMCSCLGVGTTWESVAGSQVPAEAWPNPLRNHRGVVQSGHLIWPSHQHHWQGGAGVVLCFVVIWGFVFVSVFFLFCFLVRFFKPFQYTCNGISCCGLILHFLNDWQCWTSLHVHTCHPQLFCSKISVQGFFAH